MPGAASASGAVHRPSRRRRRPHAHQGRTPQVPPPGCSVGDSPGDVTDERWPFPVGHETARCPEGRQPGNQVARRLFIVLCPPVRGRDAHPFGNVAWQAQREPPSGVRTMIRRGGKWLPRDPDNTGAARTHGLPLRVTTPVGEPLRSPAPLSGGVGPVAKLEALLFSICALIVAGKTEHGALRES